MNRFVAPLIFAIALVSVPTRRVTRSSTARDDCPKLLIACPDEVPREGKSYLVKLRVEGAARTSKLTYKWSVGGGGGEIVEGQGSPTLKVRCTHPEQTITTTVEVGGLPKQCANVASCSFSVW
jgi:hypothetical protein